MSKNKVVLSISSFFLILGVGFVVYLSVKTNSPAAEKSKEEMVQSYPKMTRKDSADEKVAAKIGDMTISEDELLGEDTMIYYEIQQREYEFKMARLRRIVTQKFLDQKTRELGIGQEEFVRKYVVQDKNINPTESEIIQFAKEQNLPDINEMKKNKEAFDQVKQFLRMKKEFDLVQVEVNKWTQTNKVDYFFKRPSLPFKLKEHVSPAWGDNNAKVVIFKFSDFECPFCARANKTLMKMKEKYKDKIRVVFKHYPLPIHKNAKNAAKASVCVHQQKPIAFWKYSEILMRNQKDLGLGALTSYAKEVGIIGAKFQECMSDPNTEMLVNEDIEVAEKLGLQTTPVFFVNGEMITGNAPVEVFEEVIDYHLNHKE